MKDIKNQIERLYKIFNFDSALFIISSVTLIKCMIRDYLSLSSTSFEVDELIKLLDVNIQLINNNNIVNSNLFESLNEFNSISINILNGHILSKYNIDTLLSCIYELSLLLNRRDYCELIWNFFDDYHSSFLKINKKYQDNYIQKNKDETIKVNFDFTNIEKKLIECRSSIKGYKNVSLQYEETHNQYQKRYWALSNDQETVIDKIYNNLDGVHLVEGVAGSGKSLVLLKLFEKINQELDNQSIFLTYNRSLVEFNKKGLKELNCDDLSINKIRTFDSYCIYLLERISNKRIFLREHGSKFESHFVLIIKEAIIKYNSRSSKVFIDPYVILNEIENYINLNFWNESEYVNSLVETNNSIRGLVYKLTKDEKKQIWDIYIIFNELLESRKYLPRNYAVIYLLKLLDNKSTFGLMNYIIVDEVQDLSIAELLLLDKLSRRSLILAGDINQSIYQKSVAWKNDRASFLINRYYLTENYRNSKEILIFSKAYLNSFNSLDKIKPLLYDSSCNGLRPRLFKRSNVRDTLTLMIDKIRIDIDEFNIDYSDILIVCVSQYILEEVEKRLNLPICRLKNTNFQESKISISTMYSSKGTGFPYMYFFLSNKIYTPSFFNLETRNSIMKRLIYVSITRSMNSLNIFIPESREPIEPIKKLIELFEK